MSDLRELLDGAATHVAAGRPDAALAAYRAALDLAPGLAEVHYNVGALLYAEGELAEARRSFAAAAQCRPEWIAPPMALGHAHFRTGNFVEAEYAFERARAIDPGSIEALGNLGLALQRRGRADLAHAYLERARELAPTDTTAWFALRTNWLQRGMTDQAIEDFLRFERGAPLSAELIVTGLMFSRFLGERDREAKYLPLALDWPYRPDQTDLAAVTVARAQYCDVSRDAMRRLYATYDYLQPRDASAAAASASTDPAPRRADGLIHIGYLSADFRAHVMGRLLRDVLAAHDRSRFAVHLYSLTPADQEDAISAEFRAVGSGFTQLASLDDRAAARAIAAGRLDLLVDLMGHSALSRPGILLGKPAPVIVSHLGYHGCIGLREVDYKLTDAFADLSDAGAYQIETPLVLDTCVLPVRRVVPAPVPVATRESLRIADSTVVFGVFVSMLKLSPRCLDLWRQILNRVPQAVLAFSPLRDPERPLYLRRLAGFGIPAARVVFIPPGNDDAQGRTRYALLGAVLDTLPYTGGDTTAAALDMGVPVVTRVGERHAERVSYSLLAHLGVTDTVADSDERYVEIACRLADDTAWRETIAATIKARLPTSGLADAARYTVSLESAYERAIAAKMPAGH
ncbi:MAG: tetratricopeptide repeat protein [Casimicrobiaceae bacterium]